MVFHSTQQNLVRPRLLQTAPTSPAGQWLVDRLGTGAPLVVPGAFDGVSARLVERNGFEAAYCSGYAAAASGYGQPDLGLLSAEETWAVYRRVRGATTIPLIVDADTGHGGLLNVARTVRDLMTLGVTAIQIEDQVNPKRCGFSDVKAVVPIDDAALRIRAAVDAAGPDGPAIIARVDALPSEGLPSAIARANRYRDEGAAIVFIDAPRSVADLTEIRQRVDGPLMYNATSVPGYPELGITDIGDLGYSLVIYPILPLYAAYAAMDSVLADLSVGRSSPRSQRPQLPTMAELDDVLEAAPILDWLSRIENNTRN